MKIVRIVDGVVVQRGEIPDDATPIAGWTVVTDQAYAVATLGARAHANGTYTPAPRAIPRILSRHEFLSLFTSAEETAIEVLAQSTASPQAAQTAAAIRVWLRRLTVVPHVDLDDPLVAAQLGRLKPLLIAAGVWANSTVADARVAAILANQPPG